MKLWAKKIVILFLALSVLCFCSCTDEQKDSPTDEQNEMVEEAIEKLEETWEDIYEETQIKTDGYLEIKNTRFIKIKHNVVEELKDIDYIIEFTLYTDYFGSSPYYHCVYGTSDTAVVYKDGDIEICERNPLRSYSSRYYSYDYSDIIKYVKDFDDEYNCVKYLE